MENFSLHGSLAYRFVTPKWLKLVNSASCFKKELWLFQYSFSPSLLKAEISFFGNEHAKKEQMWYGVTKNANKFTMISDVANFVVDDENYTTIGKFILVFFF